MKLRIIAVLLLLCTTMMFAQSAHTVQLTWTASTDTGGTVNVYRAPGSCSGTFTKLKSGVAATGPYTDTAVAVGNYCYYVTAVVGGAESNPSNQVLASVLPASPTVLVVVTN